MHGAFHPLDAATQVSATFNAEYPAADCKKFFGAAQAGYSDIPLKRIPCDKSTEKRLKKMRFRVLISS